MGFRENKCFQRRASDVFPQVNGENLEEREILKMKEGEGRLMKTGKEE